MRIAIAIGLGLLGWLCQAEAIRAQPAAPAEKKAEKATEKTASDSEGNWARDYVAEDPLVAKETITLEDIREGLDSPGRRASVIDRHFNRVAQATPKEKRDFLVEALKSEHPEVQRQAARQLSALGELESVVRDLLLEYLRSDDATQRELAVIGLEHMDLGRQQWPEEYWTALIEGLGSEDPETVRSVAQRLESQGPSAVPALLAALRDGKPKVQREAARVLAKIVGSRPAFFGTKSGGGAPGRASRENPPAPTLPRSAAPPAPAPAPQAPAPAPEARGKTPEISPPVHTARQVDPERPQTVRVYFGTNREEFAPEQPPWSKLLLYPVVAALLVMGVIYSWWHPRNAERRGCVSLVLTVCFVLGVTWSLAVFRSELLDRWRIGTGPRFGPRRDPGAVVHYGTCDVSIPPRHEVGKIETPLLGPEDENLHVVLKKTEELEEAAFFDAVRTRLASLPKDSRSCFVFIHGFNVTFENAAKRTAQIHFDLKFNGVPIFFSWPSRASIRHYFSDRNEIEFSRFVIKQFLLDVSQRVKADRIHVIAHSMGADATCRAIAELGDQGKVFDQIILAAPDIDRDVFRYQLAPRMARTANRTTMYCSKNDFALIASNAFNDAPRAGDSRDGVLVMKDLDTIDATGIDTDLLGHSYYGDCLPILHDVQQLVSLDLPPPKRKLHPWPVANELMYWTLPELTEGDKDKESKESDSTEDGKSTKDEKATKEDKATKEESNSHPTSAAGR